MYADGSGTWSPWGSQTSLTVTQDDYIDQDGGGQENWSGYDVQVRDCAGNVRTKFVVFEPAVLQQDGQTFSMVSGFAVANSGSWTVNNCLCWSGRTTARTSQPGASLTFSNLTTPWQSSNPGYIGLVMEKAPDRGVVQVYIDTTRVAVVDTYAASKQHRTIVWTGKWPSGDGHTLTVVNQGTAGRPRIDVDALLVN